MTTNQYKLLLDSLGIANRFEYDIDEEVADIKAELLKRYYKMAKKITGHDIQYCSMAILTDKIRATIFTKTVYPHYDGDVGVIHYRRACADDMDDVFFEYPLSNRITIICKPEEVVAKCEEIFNSECDVTVRPDEYQGWMEFKRWSDTINPAMNAVDLQELLGQLTAVPQIEG